MQGLRDFLGGFAGLFASSGVLWLLSLLAVALWALIFERYWYFTLVYPGAQEIALRRWKRYASAELRQARRARQLIVADVFAETHRAVGLIQALVPVILLLGLTGSIEGIMDTLQALSVDGAAGQQLVARGIAAAAVPGIAAGAMVLAALFFTRALRDRADVETRLLADRLRRG